MILRKARQADARGKWIAGALAIAVHVAFIGFLIFGVSWQNREPAPVSAELYAPPPRVAEAPKVEPPPRPPEPPPPPPEPKPEPKPEPPPKTEPRPEPKPLPKPPPKVEEAKPTKADLALKAKQEQEKKKREQERLEAEKRKAELEKRERDKKEAERKSQEAREKELREAARREAEQRESERRRQEELREAAQREQQARVAEAKRQEEARRQAERQAEARRLAAEQAARSRAEADYIRRIQAKIKGNVVLPPDLPGNPEAIFEVVQLPTGEILSVELRKSSGQRSYDDAVQRAIMKSSPLPQPERSELFQRTLTLKFRPLD